MRGPRHPALAGVVGTIAIGALLATLGRWPSARAGETPKPKAAPNLKLAKIDDVPTSLSVPLTFQYSLVIGLPRGFWIQCPRHNPVVATSLEGDGVVAQWLNGRGGTHSFLYAGSVPLIEGIPGEKPEARVQRAAQEFVAGLGEKLSRSDFTLKSAPASLEKAFVTVNGQKTAVWRTSKYVSYPAGAFSGPNATMTGEVLFFSPDLTGNLVYVALQSKAGGTSLDTVIGDLTIKPTIKVNRGGRVVQLNDIANALDQRYPVRLVSFESPPGFVQSLEVSRIKDELVYAEDRLDDAGKVTASFRIDHRDVHEGRSLAEEEAEEIRAVGGGRPGSAIEIPLATEGAHARVITFEGAVGGRRSVSRRAVFQVDDKLLRLTWHSFGDAAEVERDAASLERLLKSMQIAIRSSLK